MSAVAESQVDGIQVSGQLRDIPVSAISMNPEAISVRAVREKSRQFAELMQSIAQRGLFNPIVVRPHPKLKGRFTIVDGLHRLTAIQKLQWDTVQANVVSISDTDMLETQLIANVQRRDNSPAENARALFNIVNSNPNLTVKKLAERVSKTESWIYQQFKLLRLPKEVQEEVDAGEISLSNAYVLVKVFDTKHATPEMREDFLDKARSMNTQEYMAECEAALKQLRAEVRAGAKITGKVAPTPVMRKKTAVFTEYERYNKHITQEKAAGKNSSPKKVGYLRALEWVLQLDQETLDRKAAEREAKRKAREEKRKEKAAGTLEESLSRADEEG